MKLVSKKLAILAKSVGYNEVTDMFFNSYYPNGTDNINGLRNHDDALGTRPDFVSWPYQYELLDWLREKHYMYIVLMPKITPQNSVIWYRFTGKLKRDWKGCEPDYNILLEKCLENDLEVLKSMKKQQNVHTQQKG
jgi:hypothetical protein